jgi:multiphosphoryl transfer protein
MPLEYRFICPLPNGMHARPASCLEEIARGFESEILLENERVNYVANCKSVLSVIGGGIRLNDPCVLKISGKDESRAMQSLSIFLREKLPHCDDPAPQAPKATGEFLVPHYLHEAAVFHRGVPLVRGIGQGRIVQADEFKIPASLPQNGVTDPASERRKTEAGLEQLSNWYHDQVNHTKNKTEREIISAQRSMARDPEFRRVLMDAIDNRRRTAAGAVADAEAYFSDKLRTTGNELLRERIMDLQGACVQLLRAIYGNAAAMPEVRLQSDSIIVAKSLRPDQFLGLDRNFLKGLVLSEGGTTSHTLILARSFGIPTLTNVNLDRIKNGEEAVVDGESGAVATRLQEPAKRYYAREQQRLAERQTRLAKLLTHPATTRDGHPVELAVNITTADEAAVAFGSGAEGIGLFRTEMLFLERSSAPDEAEQFEAYSRVLQAAENRPVIIRTLDVGGDKILDYLNLPAEENPFLGFRAVRIYPVFELIFRTQIRALLRASVHGRLKIMIPMIATIEEARWVKKIIAEEKLQLTDQGIPVTGTLPVGAMIEVPAAAFSIKDLCGEFDFFSIGSNDLLQYFMAADRTNASVASLYDPLQPAFLRLLKHIVEAAHAQKKWIGLCGEMGGQTKMLPLLVGLGLDEISSATPAIPDLKLELSGLTPATCQQLLESAIKCASAGEVNALLDQFTAQTLAPLLEPELIIDNAEANTREEAIKVAIDRLYVLGRAKNSRAVEEAVWQREQTYSTGFGHGFAIPHCKTAAVQCNSLAIVKLREPVAWNSLDGQPVRLVVLLVMREVDAGDEHLKVFSRLARQIMHESFRDHLEQEKNPEALCAFFREKLGI